MDHLELLLAVTEDLVTVAEKHGVNLYALTTAMAAVLRNNGEFDLATAICTAIEARLDALDATKSSNLN